MPRTWLSDLDSVGNLGPWLQIQIHSSLHAQASGRYSQDPTSSLAYYLLLGSLPLLVSKVGEGILTRHYKTFSLPGSFPSSQRGNLTPLLKKLSFVERDLTNYCAVSDLEFLGQVIERAVTEQFQDFLDETPVLNLF